MRANDKTRPVSAEKFADRLDFSIVCVLFRNEMIKPEHHQSVRIAENFLTYRQALSCLVDPLVDDHGMSGTWPTIC